MAPTRCGPPGSPRATAARVAQALIDNAERSALERARYQAVYGIDLDDRSTYDLVLDSTTESPEALTATIVERARAAFP